MSNQPNGDISPLTLRHWTADSTRFVGSVHRASRSLPYAEPIDDKFQRLARKLARVKSELARPVR